MRVFAAVSAPPRSSARPPSALSLSRAVSPLNAKALTLALSVSSVRRQFKVLGLGLEGGGLHGWRGGAVNSAFVLPLAATGRFLLAGLCLLQPSSFVLVFFCGRAAFSRAAPRLFLCCFAFYLLTYLHGPEGHP